MSARKLCLNSDQESALWSPSETRRRRSAMTALMQGLSAAHGAPAEDDAAFHRWTVEHPELFWRFLWDDCGVIGDPGDVVLEEATRLPGASWFPKAQLNYAENLLTARDRTSTAIVFRREDGFSHSLTFGDLCEDVARCAQVFRTAGVSTGDRVAAYMPNCPETVIAMLAAASLGAVFSSASPDFGVRGVLDRFGQIAPKVLIATNGYIYNGKTHDRRSQIKEIVAELPTLTKVLVVPFITELNADLDHDIAESWTDALAAQSSTILTFTRVPFAHPLFIMFSSGTTGAPKCIVHGHGGTLLQHLKEHRYHLDIRAEDRVFYFTTCGWMMWNWLVSALALKTTLCLFDGSPAYPEVSVLFDYAAEERFTFFGTSAKFIAALKAVAAHPIDSHDLSALRTLASTGSPLSADCFGYVYSHIKSDLHLASIAGGTDIIGCFMTGNPRRPVYAGEIQGPALAMDVTVFAPDGTRLDQQAGELVCTNPFPSMPTGFWGDEDGSRYHAAYFEKFPGVWTHGDWVEKTAHGGFIIHGRSDATLNPGGVRIGTAEIYRVVEGFGGVKEALVVGQQWDGDVRVILFVIMEADATLTHDVITTLKAQIRSQCSPRHVPAKVLAVPDIPRTRSGKISELAVRDVIHGRQLNNTEALANPEVLAHYKHLSDLKT
ncbi:MAG: acetoacetate--CoA ligase [Rhodospirillaceae bacterium]